MTADLLTCLEQQAALTQTWVRQLDAEAQAMAEGRFKALSPLIQRKTALTAELAEKDRERQRLQARAGFDPARCDDEPLRQAWQQLQAITALARQRNHHHAVTTHTLLDFTRQALATLQGSGQPLYGSDGRHPSGAAGSKALAQG